MMSEAYMRETSSGSKIKATVRALWALINLLAPVALADAATPEEEFKAALAAAPPWVSDLQCRDVATADGENLADERFRKWFESMMTRVAYGVSLDGAYKQFLVDCGHDPNWSVVSAVLRFRDFLQGLTPQHVGGK